jgi:hypothetical protein
MRIVWKLSEKCWDFSSQTEVYSTSGYLSVTPLQKGLPTQISCPWTVFTEKLKVQTEKGADLEANPTIVFQYCFWNSGEVRERNLGRWPIDQNKWRVRSTSAKFELMRWWRRGHAHITQKRNPSEWIISSEDIRRKLNSLFVANATWKQIINPVSVRECEMWGWHRGQICHGGSCLCHHATWRIRQILWPVDIDGLFRRCLAQL